MNEYREACEFMMNVVGDRKRAADLLTKGENFKKLQNMMLKGKKVDILKADPKITPAVILGYNDEERQNRFNEIIKDHTSRFEEYKDKARKLLEASKQVKKKEQE